MKSLIFIGLLLGLSISTCAQIVAGEYFFDIDPGVGNATPINLSGSTIDEAYNLTLPEFETGLHKLHLRVKNSENTWSTYATSLFYVNSSSFTNNAEINAAEYFIDLDPGVGNGNIIELSSAAQLDEIFEIDLPNNLAAGDHLIYMRVQNDDGLWSTYAVGEYSATLSSKNNLLQNLKIFPNPTSDYIKVETNNLDNRIENYQIIDQLGRLIKSSKFDSSLIDFSTFADGIYLLQLKSNKGSASIKIIKQ